MSWDEWVHEGLEVWPPPLRKAVANLPLVIHPFAGELSADRRKSLVQPSLKSLDLVVFSAEIIARPKMLFSKVE